MLISPNLCLFLGEMSTQVLCGFLNCVLLLLLLSFRNSLCILDTNILSYSLQILSPFPSIFSFVVSAFGVIAKKSLPVQVMKLFPYVSFFFFRHLNTFNRTKPIFLNVSPVS